MLRSISSNWSLNFLQILVFMVLTPFTVNVFGDDYGIWAFITSSAGPLQLLALGLPMATVRAVSRAKGQQDNESASEVVGTALSMTVVLGIVAAGIGVLVYGAFVTEILTSPKWDPAAQGKSIDERVAWIVRSMDARLAMVVVLANISAGFALRLPYAIYDAHQDFIARNMIMGSGFLVKLGATVALLSWKPDLVVLAFVQVGVALLEFIVAYAVSRVRHPNIQFRPRKVDPAIAKGLLSFSVFAFLLNMGALLAFRIDAVVIGIFDDKHAIKVYTLGNQIFEPMINLLLAVGMVLMPLAATESSKGKMEVVRKAFLKWSRITSLLVLLMGGYLLVVGPAFLEAWLGDEYEHECGRLMRVLMLSFLLFLPIRGVALPVLMGLGRAKAPGIGLVAMGLANLGLSIALIGPYGLMGVALGTAIPNVVFSLIFAYLACRSLEIPLGQWSTYAFARPIGVALLASGALYGVSQLFAVEGIATVLAVGIGYTALFAVLTLLLVFRSDPDVDLSGLRNRIPGLGSRS